MRTTNLLQNYYNTNPAVTQYNSDRAKQNFDVKKELANRTFIKPLPSNGQLVRNTIFDIPSEFFRDTKYNFNALKHSLKGKANDHELGSLNDLGMKLGGIGIATALYSLKQTPLTRIMEFVGLTSFFAAMDLWPKLALQLPARLIHGFDIRQQYRDNYGTKKPVFQDHQFIPWDLYSDKEIDKIGDRLRVPKDIKNRRDFIQEKMRKIALQNNTLWMLTAGFATPIMSALICNSFEKPINNYQDEKIDLKAEKLLDNFSEEADKIKFEDNKAALNKLLTENKDKPISKELFEKITQTLSQGMNPISRLSIEKDLRNSILNDGFVFNENSLTNLQNIMTEGFEKLGISLEEMSELIPTKEELQRVFSQRDLLSDAGVTDFSEHIKTLLNLTDEKINAYAAKTNNPEIVEDLQGIVDSMLNSKQGKTPEIFKGFASIPNSRLTGEIIEKINGFSDILDKFKARNVIIDRYAYLKAAQAPEMILANTWNNISADLLKILQFSDKEIEQIRHDRLAVGDMMIEKMEKIVSDDALYENVIKSVEEKLLYLENRTDFADIEKWNKEQGNKYKKAVDTAFNQASEALDRLGMHNSARNLTGFEDVDSRSLKDLKLSFMIDRVKGVKSSFYRILNTLDTYRRISKIENVDQALHGYMPRVDKEALVEMCKQFLVKGHSSDCAVKFYFPVSMEKPWFNSEEERIAYYGQIETKDGKVINKFFDKNAANLADNAYDRNFFESAMKLMYDGKLQSDTERILKKSEALYNNFMRYRRDIIDFIGGDEYFAKKTHLVSGATGGGSSELRFLLMGAAPDEMFTNLCSQTFNGKKWLKTFTKAAGILFGITVISQFFMGKMKYDRGNK